LSAIRSALNKEPGSIGPETWGVTGLTATLNSWEGWNHQVKLRGYRIDLGEIETVLEGHPGVRATVEYLIDREMPLEGSTVPVGYEVEDTQVLLLDEAGRQVEKDQIGEISVRSRYLSPAYWQDPELTRTPFLPDLQEYEMRIYRTGELGRYREDSCLEHLGRIDSQIKFRGMRIEMREVEAALESHPGVLAAAVTVRGEKENCRLVAYVVLTHRPGPSVFEFRRYLGGRLPDYMLPAAVIELETLPLTPSGKVDQWALPEPGED
jgi:acyl-coenzyme A synthetase/AMP-(fatty) acid ligase